MENQIEAKVGVLTKEKFLAGTKFRVKGATQIYYYYDAENKQLLKNFTFIQGYPAWCGSLRRVLDVGFDWTCFEMNKSFDATSFFFDFETLE